MRKDYHLNRCRDNIQQIPHVFMIKTVLILAIEDNFLNLMKDIQGK